MSNAEPYHKPRMMKTLNGKSIRVPPGSEFIYEAQSTLDEAEEILYDLRRKIDLLHTTIRDDECDEIRELETILGDSKISAEETLTRLEIEYDINPEPLKEREIDAEVDSSVNEKLR